MAQGFVADLHPLPPAQGILADDPESPHRYRTIFLSDRLTGRLRVENSPAHAD